MSDAEQLAAALVDTTANLAAYIEQRAQDLARPRIARAERAAAERVAEVERAHELDRQRWADLDRERQRQIRALENRIGRGQREALRVIAVDVVGVGPESVHRDERLRWSAIRDALGGR